MNRKHPVELRSVYLKPGELLITCDPCEVTTVLGSCVSVTFFNLKFRYAAICHGMLPGPLPNPDSMPVHADRYKYLSEVIPVMAEKFRRLGGAMGDVEVKVFGGGNVIGLSNLENSDRWIGTVNVQAAYALLELESLKIKSRSVGGNRGRKILFNTHTGDVMHRFL